MYDARNNMVKIGSSPSEKQPGEFLVARGLLDKSGLERATRLCESSGERLNGILTKLGLITDRDMATALSAYLGIPPLSADDFPKTCILEHKVSLSFLKESRIVPLADTADGLVLAMADPFDDYAIKAIQLIAGKTVLPRVAVPEDIERVIDGFHGDDGASIETVQTGDVGEEDIERLRDLASEAPVIRLVNLLISKAVEARASDIHIEPFENTVRVRYRIDGVLR